MREVAAELNEKSFRTCGVVGILIIILAEILMFAGVKPVSIFFTPIVWTGYILFVDGLILRLRGNSLISDRRREFLLMLPISVACWLIFEAYNLHLRNWYYIGMPENLVIRIIGYVWAFATIFPGILLTSDLLDSLGIFNRLSLRACTISQKGLYGIIVTGIIFLVVPLLLPSTIARYLFALVWMGFVFLLDPINYLTGGPSLFKELGKGKIDKLLSLFLAGLICGVLWEFWNYWATTKWIYEVPFLQKPKIFEMPLVGYLGFPPFAVECYVMWNFFSALPDFDRK